MKHPFMPNSLMLLGATLLVLPSALGRYQYLHADKHLGHVGLAVRDQLSPSSKTRTAGPPVSPCTGNECVAAHPPSGNLPCGQVNNTKIIAGSQSQGWTLLCEVDFYGQDIYPFILAGSFEGCLKRCDDYNSESHVDRCAGFVFAPDRVGLENDCYLKSSVNNASSPSTIHLIGATLIPGLSTSTGPSSEPTPSPPVSNKGSSDGERIQMPTVVKTMLHGTSTDKLAKQYVSHSPSLPVKLSSKLLQPGINLDLVNKYSLASDTGSWTEFSVPFNHELANLSSFPRLSRDGGKGGNINGTHIFYFCDTSTFGDVEGPIGYMNGFVSSSAAVDTSQNALQGKALELESPIGQWQDDVGRLRGWIPLTSGEEAFNIAVSGQGFRYAVWPESSFIPLNGSHSLLYAPVVYVEVNMDTQHAEFTSLGNTLIVVSMDTFYGPHADRVVNQLFTEDEVEWGSLGGLRAWTQSGQGSDDGTIYLFGGVEGGVLVAKVPAPQFADRSAYIYWNGTGWSSTMQGKDSKAYMVDQPVMDLDVVYSPYYRTFFMIYLTPFADNTFYIRALTRGGDITAPYLPNGTNDYAEKIMQDTWSDSIPLLVVDTPAEGYIYAGGCHFGYYGDKDFANGGPMLLVTWTEHTAKDPDDPSSGYAHKSATLMMFEP